MILHNSEGIGSEPVDNLSCHNRADSRNQFGGQITDDSLPAFGKENPGPVNTELKAIFLGPFPVSLHLNLHIIHTRKFFSKCSERHLCSIIGYDCFTWNTIQLHTAVFSHGITIPRVYIQSALKFTYHRFSSSRLP